ncbi:PTS system fructose-specific EIIABC component [Corynebacterium occultum]|uniref:PTS system fructose-specific EIIABC component n=1 Tax=Corynebacterium occultum TaxID=2675219 RepID=A0A6B8W8K1_9CORY|nr:fructose-specific PTS transporter subunit EIIC [Corynebacterium occultum]QGU07615.1 PTS system fructose-specific EIIABC component [Corynebacterium occultum]
MLLDAALGDSSASVISELSQLLEVEGRVSSAAVLSAAVLAREGKSPTGFAGRVAIPHARSDAVSTPSLVFARLSRPVDFGGPDGAADLVFLIAVPTAAGKFHLRLLSKLARALLRPAFLESLRSAADADTAVAVINQVISPPGDTVPEVAGGVPGASQPVAEGWTAEKTTAEVTSPGIPQGVVTARPKPAAVLPRPTDADESALKVLAVTACPTGIAQTYMAADRLLQTAAARPDVRLMVESQGSASPVQLDPAVVSRAEVVIFAADIAVVGRERFAGKPFIECGVRRVINEPEVVLEEAIAAFENPNTSRVPAGDNAGGNAVEVDSTRERSLSFREGPASFLLGWGRRVRQAMMTGVAYMVPFVAAGGLLIALGLLLAGPQIPNIWPQMIANQSPINLMDPFLQDGQMDFRERSGWPVYLGAILYGTGSFAMQLIVPALSGFIAFGLAGRPGIAPGFVGGAVSLYVGAGFIGALVTGILAGVVAAMLGAWKPPRLVVSLMPVVIIPLIGTLAVGLAMFLLLGRPLGHVMDMLNNWLGLLDGSSALVFGALLGLMMCVDLGGPLNKAAFLFATAGLSTGDPASTTVMAAVMAGGMVPPIAMSLATLLQRHLFTAVDRENGKSAWVLGLSFITEGAIPFAASDPLRVIPSVSLGGAVAGGLCMALGVGSQAPHGGVLVLFAIDPWWAFLFAVGVGSLVGALTVILIKRLWPSRTVRGRVPVPALG